MDGYLTASKSSNYSAASSESCMGNCFYFTWKHLFVLSSELIIFPCILFVDTNECWENKEICGPNASCKNTHPHYSCICNNGFNSTTGKIKRNASVTCIGEICHNHSFKKEKKKLSHFCKFHIITTSVSV